MSVGSVVRVIKCNTARLMRQEFEFLNGVYWDDAGIWSDGYFVSTTGIDEVAVRKYIEHQGKKDLGGTKFVW